MQQMHTEFREEDRYNTVKARIIRGAMPNEIEIEKLDRAVATIGKQLLLLDAAISQLKSAVNILEIHAAIQIAPGNPLDGLKALRALQKKAIESDPHAQENRQAAELIDLIQQWQKEHGGPFGRS
jgi:hypothetical protein